MGIPVIDTITKGIGELFGFIDNVHTSEEEKLNLKSSLLSIQAQVLSQVIDYEVRLAEAKRDIITTEAKSDSWITRSWRPITMLAFVALAIYSYISGNGLPEPLWTTIQIGLGGYIGGRSLEKMVPGVMEALKSREET